MTSFSTRLKELRVEHHFTAKAVANAVGLSKNAITNYEAGIREPSLDTLKALCLLFNVSADYLLGLSDLY